MLVSDSLRRVTETTLDRCLLSTVLLRVELWNETQEGENKRSELIHVSLITGHFNTHHFHCINPMGSTKENFNKQMNNFNETLNTQ